MEHRNGCSWTRANDDGSGITGICVGNDGTTIFCCGVGGNVYKKPNWQATGADGWTLAGNYTCCVTSIAQGQDGTIVGVGTDNTLWSNNGDFSTNWTHTNTPGEWVSSVCIAPDGSLFVIGSNGCIFKKNSYKNLPSQSWQQMTGSNGVFSGMTIAADGTCYGIGTNNYLYTWPSYKTINNTDEWSPISNSCCVISIATVSNENLTYFKGKTFLGSGSISNTSASSVEDCQALCSNTSGCTGATFNSDKGACLIRSGEGDLSNGTKNDYAIMVEGPGLLKLSKHLNNKLTQINNQISNIVGDGTEMNNQSLERKQKTHDLVANAKKLDMERDKIKKFIDEYQDLDEAEVEGSLMTNSNYYSFLLLLILAIVFVICLIMFLPSSAKSSSSGTTPSPATPSGIAPAQTGGSILKKINKITLGFFK
jgi:hypothetical protein